MCAVGEKGVVKEAMDRKEYLQPYFDQVAEFHSYLSPGSVIGVFMVDLAKELLGPPRSFIRAVVETSACVPDAVQLMTDCTCGNNWMKVKDWGKMALTLYDREERGGVRVFLDIDKIKKYPLIYQWYMKSSEVDHDKVTGELIDIGRNILSWQRVKVNLPRKVKRTFVVCPSCNETHLASDGELCQRCSGSDNYYEIIDEDLVASPTSMTGVPVGDRPVLLSDNGPGISL